MEVIALMLGGFAILRCDSLLGNLISTDLDSGLTDLGGKRVATVLTVGGLNTSASG